VFSRLNTHCRVAACLVGALYLPAAFALDPHKSLTQYSRQSWGQVDGLPQDTIRAIAQTADGYLWLGTDEGLARFDGYEFTVFTKTDGSLPANSITALAADPDGSLWIGTPRGLTRFHAKSFHTFTTKDGLPDDAVTGLYSDHAGTLWIVANNVSLSRFQNGRFTNYSPGANILSVRAIREDPHHDLVAAGFGGVVRISGDKYTTLIDNATVGGDVISSLLVDRHDNLWVAGSLGLMLRTPAGHIRKFDTRDGLPDLYVRAVLEDRDGNIWIGTNGGLARFQGDRFVASAEGGRDSDLVRCLLEDREGDLWMGANNGLTRLRDDAFTVYGKTEGLPSDEPNTVFQDHAGRIWVGFHEGGLMLFSGDRRRFSPSDGMPETEVFSIRESANHDLLLSTRVGLVRMHGSGFSTTIPPDPLSRRIVFDALEDSAGRLWLAGPAGLFEVQGQQIRTVLPGGAATASSVVTLCETRDGALWAGTFGKGLWRIQDKDVRSYSLATGLSSDNIRELYQDPDGTLWIGTFGGGLGALREGHFQWFTQQDGLLSDNVANIADDGESLWLSTTRGICRIAKRQLTDFAAGKIKSLYPINYGAGDGLRSAQCSPGYPTGGGGDRTADGRLWFTTSRGLAVFNPRATPPASVPPAVQLLDIAADANSVDLSKAARFAPDIQRFRIRYAAIHLSAPERVQYFYKLTGLEPGWVSAGARREINYNSLKHGHYIFSVKAQIPGGPSTEQSFAFDVLPHYYETVWFRLFCVAMLIAGAWAVYQARLRRIRYRFALILGERARLAREIHDTLAQGFVGIASQLDAVSMLIPTEPSPVRKYLDMARRMARHSLTEARRSVMDLRASALEGHDLAGAIQTSTRTWTAGSPVDVAVDVSGPATVLPEEMEQHLLRIAQEAVTNVLKHAAASRVVIQLHTEARRIRLRIRDNGRGFEQQGVFSSSGGHFGLIGMRERAERLGGELRLASQPGGGTEVEVTVPLP
jgi:signal transduction histidine kinase/ligand-binding sensor domain-containing protein